MGWLDIWRRWLVCSTSDAFPRTVRVLLSMLTPRQRQTLLALARHSVHQRVRGSECEEWTEPCEMPLASGVFVTLRTRGELRGCLGTLDCEAGLRAEVARCAAEAASEDPRFPPVSNEELPDVLIEISVLGPLQQIDPTGVDAFSIGHHGLVVEQGDHRGLLLPQVAVEWSWTGEQFLRQTCVKAGLPADAWQRGAAVYRFDAEVFGE